VLVEPELGFELTPEIAVIMPIRLRPEPTHLGKLRIQYQAGMDVWVETARRCGTGEYDVNVLDYKNGPGTRFGVKKLKSRRLVVEGFGPPRNLAPAQPVIYPAVPEPPRMAPQAPSEASMSTPPIVQSIPELAATSANAAQADGGLTQILLRMYERKSAEAAQLLQAEATRELGQVRGDIAKLTEVVNVLVTEVRGIKEGIAQLAKTLEGTPLATLEQAQALNERITQMGLLPLAALAHKERASDPGLAELVAPLIEPLKPFLMHLFQEWLASRHAAGAQPTADDDAAPTAIYRPRRPVNGGGN
jgi:hypothetical protein